MFTSLLPSSRCFLQILSPKIGRMASTFQSDWSECLAESTASGSSLLASRPSRLYSVLTILSHPDPSRVGERSILYGFLSNRPEPISRLEPFFEPPGRNREPRPLGDTRLSRKPILVARSGEERYLFDRAGSPMTLSVDGRGIDGSSHLEGSLERGFVLLLAGAVVLFLHELEVDGSDPSDSPGAEITEGTSSLVGESPALARVRQRILKVADLPLSVLVRGESGTGKELVAQSIFQNSNRREQPFVAVNMAAISPALATSELFGSEKGAFTGAYQRRIGYFQEAAGGTIFLDEIGETPPETQALLLRTLESGEIQSVGGRASQKIDVRVIAATDRNLEEAVSQGEFRSPLLHRLSTFEIVLPPLRERREDIGRLFYFFLRKYTGELLGGRSRDDSDPVLPRVSAQLIARIALFSWPGNVRQLANLVRQLVVESRDSGEIRPVEREIETLLRRSALPASDVASDSVRISTSKVRTKRARYRDPDDVSEGELLEVMESCEWMPHRAAPILRVSRPSLYNLIDRSSILRRAADITREEISLTIDRGLSFDEMVGEFRVSKRALKSRMKELGLL